MQSTLITITPIYSLIGVLLVLPDQVLQALLLLHRRGAGLGRGLGGPGGVLHGAHGLVVDLQTVGDTPEIRQLNRK